MKSRKTSRAERLREDIDRAVEPNAKPLPTPTERGTERPKLSPREFIHRRMRELDKQEEDKR